MTEKVTRLMKDVPAIRWTALVLLALAMYFAYIFMDILSPLKELLESERGWDPIAYGNYAGSETFLNVFVFFLIFAGIILDKMGVRFTAILSGVVMVMGACLNWYAVSDLFMGSGAETFLTDYLNLPAKAWNITPFYAGMPASAKMSAIGFMIFGCGVEMAGITVSRGIVKWFKGKEMALAMGMEMALARVGVASVMLLSPILANRSPISVSRPVAVAAVLLIIGLISFIAYSFMDKKLDAQTNEKEEKDDPFKIIDLGKIFSSMGFWLVALLCVLYYSAIFPFQKYAIDMLQCNLNYSSEQAGLVFFVFPLGAAAITPFLGNYIDKKGKAASMLILGATLMIICHLTFAFILPATQSALIAYLGIILLGVSFSLVPASLWPSVPKLVENKLLGSAYALIFWVQNIGLYAFPMVIGWTLYTTNPGISEGNRNYNILLNYSSYQASKSINEMALFVIHADASYTSEMNNYIRETSLDNAKIQTRLSEAEEKIKEIITPEIQDKFLNYSSQLKQMIDDKDKAETKNLLSDFQNYITTTIPKEKIEDLNRYLPFLNTNLLFVNTTTENKEANLKEITLTKISKIETILSTINPQNDSLAQQYFLSELQSVKGRFLTKKEISESKIELSRINPYNYKMPMVVFASLGVLALFLGFLLKIVDKKKKLGLELPNIKR
jgi:MFS family permease